MPIRINLLADAIAAEELRRRDPVKRASFAGALLVAASLVWYSSTWLGYMVNRENLNNVEGELQKRASDYNRFTDNSKKIADVQRRIDALSQLNTERFLQGNLLNALQKTYVPNVQLSQMHVEQTYAESAAVAAKTNNFGVVPGHPAAVTEHIKVVLDAKDFSANPGDKVNDFKDALQAQSYFKSALNPTNGVRLSALSPLQTQGEARPFVMFSLECRFQDRP